MKIFRSFVAIHSHRTPIHVFIRSDRNAKFSFNWNKDMKSDEMDVRNWRTLWAFDADDAVGNSTIKILWM